MSLLAFVFQNLWTPKTLLHTCLKRQLSEEPSTSKTADVPKHFWNLHHNIFVWIVDRCQVKTAC